MATSRATVPREEANATSNAVRDYTRATVKKYVKAGAKDLTERGVNRTAKRVLNETVGVVPAGLPVAPVPSYWFATTNLWWVTVRGSYLRFTVRAYTGSPRGSGVSLQYVRDGSTVTLDVDGDGEAERLGRSERLSFETHAVAVTAVPGRNWVGDVDGDADERSKGWENGPGCVGESPDERSCRAS